MKIQSLRPPDQVLLVGAATSWTLEADTVAMEGNREYLRVKREPFGAIK
jgi:hypothetical protein